MARAYLDYNATAPMTEVVKQAIIEQMDGRALNPSSVHGSGRHARAVMEAARRKVQVALNAQEAELIFTATGTEANQLAVLGSGRKRVIVSAIEHPSVLKIKAVSNIAPVNSQGVVDIVGLEKLLRAGMGEKAIVSVMLANNETGAIQPIAKIVAMAKQYGAYVHVDAIQAFGKIPVDFTALDVDFLSVSAHKLGGGTGAAALVVRKGIDVQAQHVGGGQEKRRRAGTENVLAIHGFGVAAEHAVAQLAEAAKEQQVLRDEMEQMIKAAAPDAVIFAEKVKRLPNTSAIAMPHVPSQTQLMCFDLEGLEVSAGSACSSGKVEMSHVLQAMNIKRDVAETMVRVSIGRATTKEELQHFVKVWADVYKTAQQKAA